MLTTIEGKVINLENVLYVPTMIKNLISLSRLLETDEYVVKFDRSGCRLLVRSDHSQVAKVSLQDRLYAFHLQPPRAAPSMHVTARSAVGDIDPSMLWHARLVISTKRNWFPSVPLMNCTGTSCHTSPNLIFVIHAHVEKSSKYLIPKPRLQSYRVAGAGTHGPLRSHFDTFSSRLSIFYALCR